MLRKPESVISALSGSAVFVPPIGRMLGAEPGLFSQQDKGKGEALVADVACKSFCLLGSTEEI